LKQSRPFKTLKDKIQQSLNLKNEGHQLPSQNSNPLNQRDARATDFAYKTSGEKTTNSLFASMIIPSAQLVRDVFASMYQRWDGTEARDGAKAILIHTSTHQLPKWEWTPPHHKAAFSPPYGSANYEASFKFTKCAFTWVQLKLNQG
jgi:hypothetical protein